MAGQQSPKDVTYVHGKHQRSIRGGIIGLKDGCVGILRKESPVGIFDPELALDLSKAKLKEMVEDWPELSDTAKKQRAREWTLARRRALAPAILPGGDVPPALAPAVLPGGDAPPALAPAVLPGGDVPSALVPGGDLPPALSPAVLPGGDLMEDKDEEVMEDLLYPAPTLLDAK